MIPFHEPLIGATTTACVGSVWVMARHLLVSQALSAALGRGVADVRALAWGSDALRGADIEPTEDVLLVVDPLDSPASIASVRTLLAGVSFRALVMTTLRKGPAWGALIAAGVTELIPEPESVGELSVILEQVCAGEPVMSEEERETLREHWDRHVAEEEELLDRMAELSPRERMVLQSLASGRRSSEIAATLGVAQSTVRTHIRSIRRKLDVDSQLRAVLVAHRLEARIPPSTVEVPTPRRPEE